MSEKETNLRLIFLIGFVTTLDLSQAQFFSSPYSHPGQFYALPYSSQWRQQQETYTCPKPTGQFDHPKYCDLFLNCWEGRPTVDKCGGGLLFNEKIAGCDYPRNVDCKGRGVSRPPQSIDNRCPDPFGTYPNPANCSEYFVCHGGVANVVGCSEDTYYDPAISVCTHQEPQSCIDLHPCSDPSAPGCPPIPAGSPTQAPTDPPTQPPSQTYPLRPKPSLSPDGPNPSQPQFEQPGPTPTRPDPVKPEKPTSQTQEVSTVNLKPRPPLKPQEPSRPEQEIVPPEIEQPTNPPTPPLKPGNFKPVEPGGPPVGPTTPRPEAPDGEDDPNVLFPFLPAFPGSFKCPVFSGVLPIVGDCERVVVCVGGESHLLRCPAGHGFDLVQGRCNESRSSCHGNRNQPGKVLYVSVPSSLLYEELNGTRVQAY